MIGENRRVSESGPFLGNFLPEYPGSAMLFAVQRGAESMVPVLEASVIEPSVTRT
jgi:hypothetical protein